MIDPRFKTYPAPVPAGENVEPYTSHWFMLQMIGSNKRVLEFGCATGYMSARLKAAGCHVTAIEIDAEAATLAKDVCDEVIVADLDMQPLANILPEATFDVVVFGDVLEHLRDPWTVLQESRRYLGDGGYAVISIPNVAHGSIRLALLGGSFEYRELGILDDTHLRFFTLRTVEELCMRAGYTVENVERTKVGLFDVTALTPTLNELHFDPELIEQVKRDPEHDTLQFVLKAQPLDDREKYVVLSKELASVRAKLRESETAARVSHEAYEEIEALFEERERTAGAPVVEAIATKPGLRKPEKTISARSIKRAERYRAEATAERALRAELEATNEHLTRALQTTREQHRQRTRATDETIEKLQKRLAAAVAAHERCADVSSEYAKYRETTSALVLRFVRYAETELESVLARTAEIDAAMRAVQHSKMWWLKMALRRLRR